MAITDESENACAISNFETNAEAQLILRYVRETDQSLFLTGKAGSGKTTLLKHLLQDLPKRFMVTAPTGVAAINAQGVTLHSFFQLPFGPFVPHHAEYGQMRPSRFSREKLDMIRSLELLVIDEISMVRADTLDRVDHVLRDVRRCHAPFGGVQLLMIGDLYQLSPVVRKEEKIVLGGAYPTPYFFSAHVFQHSLFTTIELKKIYRQSDPIFIDILNRVRENCLTGAALARLNTCAEPPKTRANESKRITLTTHNKIADDINQKALMALKGRVRTFRAVIQDNYPSHAFPAPDVLTLKRGAQVMFVRNDSNVQKRFYNGKIGIITNLDSEKIVIRCEQDNKDENITVEREKWENVTYTLNAETKEIETEVVGTFSQFPLRLAWAVTIHKSQGLTFESVTIDACSSFASGQVYVALSRCRSLEGIELTSPISRSVIKTDEQVNHFYRYATEHRPNEQALNSARIQFQQRLINSCFSFDRLTQAWHNLKKLLQQNETVLYVTCHTSIHNLNADFTSSVAEIAAKFQRELIRRFCTDELVPQEDKVLQTRIAKAAAYFLPYIKRIESWCAGFDIDTENKSIRRSILAARDAVWQSAYCSRVCLSSCQEGFDVDRFLRVRSTADMTWYDDSAINNKSLRAKKMQGIDAESNKTLGDAGPDRGQIKHPELYEHLKCWRAEQARARQVEPRRIMHQNQLLCIAAALPQSLEVLSKVKGIGRKTVDRYGEELIAVVMNYCQSIGCDV
ncbi:MAG: HRDC domain-containing protein [Gammaproteobacteria bacterium]